MDEVQKHNSFNSSPCIQIWYVNHLTTVLHTHSHKLILFCTLGNPVFTLHAQVIKCLIWSECNYVCRSGLSPDIKRVGSWTTGSEPLLAWMRYSGYEEALSYAIPPPKKS
jgi:hypothetical protein